MSNQAASECSSQGNSTKYISQQNFALKLRFLFPTRLGTFRYFSAQDVLRILQLGVHIPGRWSSPITTIDNYSCSINIISSIAEKIYASVGDLFHSPPSAN